MPHFKQRPKVTIEDLIRLKRDERPAAEFWVNFDHELRQKQLTALLEKRAWWQELPQLLMRRAYLPVGATAILAFTFVSVKYYGPTQVAAPVQQSQVAAEPVGANQAVGSPLANGSPMIAAVLEARPAEATDSTPLPEPIELMPRQTRAVASETPSVQTIAANLASFELTEPELVNSVRGIRLSPAARIQNVDLVVSELASVPTNASMRSRILAQYADRPLSREPSAPEIVRERLARRLGNSDITDRLNRIGLRGDQVSLGVTLRL
ncbi:MAG: hypothetical protein EBT62_01070 [Opitutaceae bacterium]|jgi:hypothetical protein|nr:hypothetical protein [Opitutaceae bacterium]